MLHTRVYDVRDLVRRVIPRAVAAGLVRRGRDGDYFVPFGGYTEGGSWSGGGAGGGAFSITARQIGGGIGGFQGPVHQVPWSGYRHPAAYLRAVERVLTPEAWEPVEDSDFRPLIEVAVATTGGLDNGGAWEDDGGFGTAEKLRYGSPGEVRLALIVRQTETVHRQIADLLADLRDLPADAGPAAGGDD